MQKAQGEYHSSYIFAGRIDVQAYLEVQGFFDVDHPQRDRVDVIELGACHRERKRWMMIQHATWMD